MLITKSYKPGTKKPLRTDRQWLMIDFAGVVLGEKWSGKSPAETRQLNFPLSHQRGQAIGPINLISWSRALGRLMHDRWWFSFSRFNLVSNYVNGLV